MENNSDVIIAYWKALLKSTGGTTLKNSLRYFLYPDNIDLRKFAANTKILILKSIKTYQDRVKSTGEIDLSQFITPSIEIVANPIKPGNYPNWFLIAYPDVVLWFQRLSDKERKDTLNQRLNNIILDNNLQNLRKIVVFYKKNFTLESSIKDKKDREDFERLLLKLSKQPAQKQDSNEEKIKQFNKKWQRKSTIVVGEELDGSIRIVSRSNMSKQKTAKLSLKERIKQFNQKQKEKNPELYKKMEESAKEGTQVIFRPERPKRKSSG
jgi:hypothetical protein